MLVKFAKAIFYSILIGIIGTLLYVGYFYFEGFLTTRSALSAVVEVVSRENCLASEKIYMDSVGNAVSMQDKVKKTLDDYSNSSWYLDFNTSAGNFVGTDKTVCVTYLDDEGNRVGAYSYTKASQRGATIEIEVKSTLSMVLRLMPEINGEKFVLELPIKVKANTVGLRYYKGKDI